MNYSILQLCIVLFVIMFFQTLFIESFLRNGIENHPSIIRIEILCCIIFMSYLHAYLREYCLQTVIYQYRSIFNIHSWFLLFNFFFLSTKKSFRSNPLL